MPSPRGTCLIAVCVATVLTLVPITLVTTAAGFLLLAYFPGRALLRALGIEDHWSRGGCIVLSVAVSLAFVPLFLNPLWHLTHNSYVMLGITSVATLMLTYFGRCGPSSPIEPMFEHRRTRIAAGIFYMIHYP